MARGTTTPGILLSIPVLAIKLQKMSYLIENLECERSFLRQLWGFWKNLEPMLEILGFNPHCCWALIEIDMDDLASSLPTQCE